MITFVKAQIGKLSLFEIYFFMIYQMIFFMDSGRKKYYCFTIPYQDKLKTMAENP